LFTESRWLVQTGIKIGLAYTPEPCTKRLWPSRLQRLTPVTGLMSGLVISQLGWYRGNKNPSLFGDGFYLFCITKEENIWKTTY
jgi:hypothetical protein